MLALLKELITETIAVLRLLCALLWWLKVSPDGFGKLVQIEERLLNMGKVFDYSLELLPVKPGVDSQRLVVTVDGTSRDPIALAADATSVTITDLPEGASVTLSLDYLDSAGNDSANVEVALIVTDEIGPDAPDGFGALTQIAEREV
jgi:hypothetical protein